MNYFPIDKLCSRSLSSPCDRRCGFEIHIPPDVPIYDGHIHLNQIVEKIQSDLLSAKCLPPVRQYHFVNNNHKPHEWPLHNPSPFSPFSPFSPHVYIYHTIGIHPKQFTPLSIYQDLNDLNGHLETARFEMNVTKKIVAVGEFGLDETAATNKNHQLFVIQKQIDLATQYHLPIVIHCRGFDNYRTMFDCLNRWISDRDMPIHWHCVNSESDVHIIDLFLHRFPNSYIGLNGSITYDNNNETSLIFNNWLADRSSFLPERLIFETDYPYLMPRNLLGVYDPSRAIICTALYLQKMMKNHQHNMMSLLLSSSSNIKCMYKL